ncbi:MAG: sigma-70 family RNA polymerase sigma factor [Acidimicrobiales bacterium]
MTRKGPDIQTSDDLDLARAAAGGDGSAFDELYRAHADAAWRVAFAVTGNRDDAADAVADAFTRFLTALTSGRLADLANVRAYLLSTTRNAAIDVLRRNGRLQPMDDLPHAEVGSLNAGPSDRVLDGLDAAFVSTAFLSLPERWRSVLWLTEVEEMSPADVAMLMGVSANNAAQLAVRARAGLRQRFLQAHVRDEADSKCAFTLDRLGAYVGGALAPRDIAKVDQHLAGCDSCRAVQEELADLGTTLRRVAMPLPLALGALAWRHWLDVSSASEAGLRVVTGMRGQRPLTGVSVGLLGLGIIALGILGHPNLGLAGAAPHQLAGPAIGSRPVILAEDRAAAQAPAPALALAVPGLPALPATSATVPGSAAGAAGPGTGTGSGGTTGPGGSATPGSPAGGSSPAPGTPAPSAPTGPTLQLSTQINLAPAPASATLGAGQGTGSATGAAVSTPATSQSAGSPPPSSPSQSSTPSATVSATAPGTGSTSATLPSAGGSSAGGSSAELPVAAKVPLP